jgi:oligoribonuclease NrnB/cAMP/cGMP phosphodiesterase (DHH superfamily)
MSELFPPDYHWLIDHHRKHHEEDEMRNAGLQKFMDTQETEIARLKTDLAQAQRHADRWRAYGEKASEAIRDAREVMELLAEQTKNTCYFSTDELGLVSYMEVARNWINSYHPLTSKNVEGEE